MEVLKNESDRLQPVYMSQQEANEVMELWADLQKAESARQSMLTVHDVAEAIQLPPDQVAQFLKQVRQKQSSPHQTVNQPRIQSVPRDLSDGLLVKLLYLSIWSMAMLMCGAVAASNVGQGGLFLLPFLMIVGTFVFSTGTLIYRKVARRIVNKHLSQHDPFHGN